MTRPRRPLRSLLVAALVVATAGCASDLTEDTAAPLAPPIPYAADVPVESLALEHEALEPVDFVQRDVSFRFAAVCQERPHTVAYTWLSAAARSVGLTQEQRNLAYGALPDVALWLVH